ncbi:hypothetical protein BH20ACT4_BH20ACT4_14850 [soil metagenome]
MELILPSARRHGVEDDDVRHALHNAIVFHDQDDEVIIAVGPDRAGRLVEVGFLESDDEHRVIIHAMRPARRTYPPT